MQIYVKILHLNIVENYKSGLKYNNKFDNLLFYQIYTILLKQVGLKTIFLNTFVKSNKFMNTQF